MSGMIDYFLDRITMYRLVLYYLVVIIVIAVVGSFLGKIPYSPLSIVLSTAFIAICCLVTNKIFAYTFKAPTNNESIYITALILVLIAAPLHNIHDLPFLGWVSVLAVASKYILTYNKKHIFNPAAIGAVIIAVGLNQSANWWVGNTFLAPFVFLGGLLIVRKIKKEDLLFGFFCVSMGIILSIGIYKGSDILNLTSQLLFHSSLLFFAFVMLTEPLTTPPSKKMQILYGTIVGILFVPQIHIGSIYSTPELALVVGNVFSFFVSPKQKLILFLKEKNQSGSDTIDFIFSPQKKLQFVPGQYMEWTLQHPHSDSRGERRYLTIASSPTEDNLRIGLKFYPKSSSFKKALLNIDSNIPIVASQLSGEFTLPKDPLQKCVFIAGGIGITPFRSIVKFLLDIKQKRDIILFYANKKAEEIAYTDIFNQAATELGIKTIYTLTDTENINQDWNGKIGRIDEAMIKTEASDYLQRIFYISGPQTMVTETKKTLLNMGIKTKNIKIDFFPGLV